MPGEQVSSINKIYPTLYPERYWCVLANIRWELSDWYFGEYQKATIPFDVIVRYGLDDTHNLEMPSCNQTLSSTQ